MHHVEVKIGALGDPPLFPLHAKEKLIEGELQTVGVLEAGTTNGNTSLYCTVRTNAGRVCFQLTLAMLQNITAIATGADKRFHEKRSNN